MPGFEIWTVVKVPFPYTDRPVRQHRPALVVRAGGSLAEPGLLWVLMITSAANRGWPGDADVTDLAAAGLPVPSLVRTAKIATIESAHAERLGTLATADRAAVERRLADALPRPAP